MKLKTLIFLFLSTTVFAQSYIIPQPLSFESKKETFLLDKYTSLIFSEADPRANAMVGLFENYLIEKGILIQKNKLAKNSIKINFLPVADPKLDKEGYKLDISTNQISIICNANGGLHNALQTLKQMIETQLTGSNTDKAALIETCVITDSPRFGWRGLMLDVSRNFFTVNEVKAYIDLMSTYKFNVLHWHLTDDEGWRVEIKALPKLTEVGAWRVERNGRFGDGRPYPKPGEKATNGGFYTQEQIRDVVQYALDRNIQILPEIDIPGHSMAALAAYPELSTKKEPHFVNPGSKFAEWYPNNTFKMLIENTLNPVDENVYTFIDKVMTEVASLFPFEYIHMGGDESYHGFWEADKKAQAFMKANKIKDTHELQSYFVSRVSKIVNAKQKKLIGWDEILEGGLVEDAAVMSWRGVKGGIEAAKKGHSVVMSPTTHAYIDYMQGDAAVENTIYSSLNLAKTYSFEPVPEGVEAKYILGTQGNLWSEVVPSLPFAFYMTYPRAFAIAENGWTAPNLKNYDNFLTRVENHIERFEAMNISIAKTIFEPEVMVKKEGDKKIITLKTDIKNAEIYYSVNNTYPVNFSKKYTGPFEKPEGNYSLRTQVFRNGKALGRELIIPAADIEKRAK